MGKKQYYRRAWQRSRLAALALSFAATTTFATNFAFPSPLPPTGAENLNNVKQIVSFIWDDNAYSGLEATHYETAPGQAYANQSWIGGIKPWGAGATNLLELQPGDIGMSWAISKLAGRSMSTPEWKSDAVYTKGMQVEYQGKIWEAKYWITGTAPAEGDNPFTLIGPAVDNLTKQNPDGSPITMTFNVISGLLVPIYGPNEDNRESKYGFWTTTATDIKEFTHLTVGTKVAAAWGREQMVKATANATGNVNGEIYGQINEVFKMTKKFGHEIGNHTIDHMESNSPLPNDNRGFGRWGGEGFAANMVETVEYGDTSFQVDESKEFGRTPGITWHTMGWKPDAGRMLSINGWKGLIELGDLELKEALDISVESKTAVAFRAPRLEVNSNMFHALKQLNYLYDTGNEEGYEYNMNGTNFLWPYTMDNGSPNVAWQRMAGVNKTNFDSLPTGLWQYPVGVFIVPEGEHRQNIWNNYAEIAAAEGRPQTDADKEHFLKVGKITGFDFNLFILYGATKDIAIATLRHSLDQRMKGGKAPFQVGSHTDYFTPIYDIATLQEPANINTYGLALKWNDWKARIASYEDLVDYAINNGAYVWDGKKTIEYIQSLVAQAKVGATEKEIKNWQFFSHSQKSQLTGGDLASGADITTTQTVGNDMEVAGFAAYGSAGDFEFDHISLEYSTTAPLTIRLITTDPIDKSYPYEVTLNNLNGFNGWDGSRAVNKNRFVYSNKIPLSAFQRNQYVALDADPNISKLTGLRSQGTDWTKTITGIEISVQTPPVKQPQSKFETQKNWVSVKNFTLFSGEQTGGITVGLAKTPKIAMQRMAVLGMTGNSLKLNMVKTGIYNVDVVTVNGRLVKSFRDVNLNAGVNTLQLNNLSTGMYMIRINNRQQGINTTLKSLVL